MNIENLWYNDNFESYRIENGLDTNEIWRVIAKHKDMCVVKTGSGEFFANITWKLRFKNEDIHAFPWVGDWVAISVYGQRKGVIQKIFPRYSILSRQKAGKATQQQIIATNIDYGLIVVSVDRDFSINRIERYLAICYSSKITPIVVISKIDLISTFDLESLLDQIKNRIKNVLVITISSESGSWFESLKEMIEKGKTYCLLGSSWVWKSTLINNLFGKIIMKTGYISDKAVRWKHTTTNRELLILENGGIIIDNPGMREVWMTDNFVWIYSTFEEIMELSGQCKFNDCSHNWDKGCAIEKAYKDGKIDEESFRNFQRLQKESFHYTESRLEKKKKEKNLSKMVRDIKKWPKRNKY